MSRGTPASERARRLVALLGRLTPGARVAIAELAEQVGTTPAELAGDLETLALCGVAPYDPGDLLPLMIEDGYVEVWGQLPAVKGPVRLSAAEARALIAALQAAGIDEPRLISRLVEAAAGDGFDPADLEHTIRAASSAHESAVYATLAQGLQEQRVVKLEYVSGGTEERTARDVEPLSLFAERGAWYLTAWCRKASDWRTFRVDRVRAASLSSESFDATARAARTASRSSDGATVEALATADLPRAHLRFAPSAPFSEREWPGAQVVETSTDGSVVASVPYAGTRWITRHVVAGLGTVEVIEPAGVREAVHALARKLSGEAG